MTVAALNAVDAQAVADRHEDELARAYEKVLRAAGRTAASRFKRFSPLVATTTEPGQPNWAPPNIDELLDLTTITAQTARATGSIHLKTLAAVLDAYGKTVRSVTVPVTGRPAFDVTNPLSLTLLDRIGGRSGDVSAAVRDELARIIGDAYQQGYSVIQTADEIVQLSDQFSVAQSRMLARTDLNGIANGGSVIAATAVGVAFKQWLTAEDDLVRPSHQDADGQTVPIGDQFDVGGEGADYPGDPQLSDAEAANCRCTVIYTDSLGEDTGLTAATVGATIGGAMEAAQITIPLTFSIGTATTVAKTNEISNSYVAVVPDVVEKDESPAVVAAASGPSWRAVLCVEGQPTEDGRLLAPGSITWRDLPLSLLCQTETAAGHDGSVVCGRIDRIWRDGSNIIGEGVFDSGEFGIETARLVGEQVLRGVSIDLAILEYEIRPADALAVIDTDAEGADELFVVTDGVIGAATICSFQAIANATIEVLAAAGPLRFRVTRTFDPDSGAALTAAAVGVAEHPPAHWFDNPRLTGPTPITVSDDGQIVGHAALWNTCHVGVPGSCVTAPRSRADYAYFHLGAVKADDGAEVAVGQITLGTGHASLRANSEQAMEHYDNTGTVGGDVHVGEDAYGIWVAGAVRPELSADRLRTLRGAKLSGDWRNINGHLELVGLLAVNVPGFPVPRPSARVASGALEPERMALIAAGLAEDVPPPDLAIRSRVLAARARGGIEALAELARS